MATVTNYNPYTNGTSAYGCTSQNYTDSDGYTYQKYTPNNDTLYYYPGVTATKHITIYDNNNIPTIKILYKIILGDGSWVYYNYTKLGSDSFTISSNMTKDNKLYYFICGCGGDGRKSEKSTANLGGNPGAYSDTYIDLSANISTTYTTSIKNNPCGGTESIFTYPPTTAYDPVTGANPQQTRSATNGLTGAIDTYGNLVDASSNNISLIFCDNLSNVILIGGTGGNGGTHDAKTGFSGNGGGGGGSGDGTHHKGIGGKGTNGHSGGDSSRNDLGEYGNGGSGGAAFKFSEGGIGGGGGGGGNGEGGVAASAKNGNGGAGGTGAIMFYYKKA
jgi:hypothetical protein